MTENKRLLITGCNRGLGHGIATVAIEQGYEVIALGRTEPKDLMGSNSLKFTYVDFGELDSIAKSTRTALRTIDHIDLVVLNAGVLGKLAHMSEVDTSDLKQTMDVNVWSNKVLLNTLFDLPIRISSVLAISSGAAVSGHRGWAGYALSKATFVMLIKLFANEHPDTHFLSLAPGLIDTNMQSTIRDLDQDQAFPSFERLRAAHGTPNMPNPEDAARHIFHMLTGPMGQLPSGNFADIRDPSLGF